MDELINSMKKRGLISLASDKMRAKLILNLVIASTTEPIETDPDWWELRLYLVRN